MNNNIRVENSNNTLIKIAKGVVFSFFITLIAIFIFSIILTYTNISENIIPVVIIVLTFISILSGSIISMRNMYKNGMINGGTIGGIYVTLLYLISSILNTGFTFNIYTVLMIVVGMIAGVVGGIIGVNI